jgi:hypothetical protein
MVTAGAYAWHEWATGSTTEVVHGSHLNGNFDFISHIVNTGVGSENIEAGAVVAAKITDGAIGEAHINHGTDGGARVLMIGLADDTTGSAMMVWGTVLIGAANTTNTDVTVTFSNGEMCTAGDPGYSATPVVGAYIITAAASEMDVNPTSVGTEQAVFNIDLPGAVTFTEDVVMYWWAVGCR